MRTIVSNIYSKAFPKKEGEEYTAKELISHFWGWLLVLVFFFLIAKFIYDKHRFHPDSGPPPVYKQAPGTAPAQQRVISSPWQ